MGLVNRLWWEKGECAGQRPRKGWAERLADFPQACMRRIRASAFIRPRTILEFRARVYNEFDKGSGKDAVRRADEGARLSFFAQGSGRHRELRPVSAEQGGQEVDSTVGLGKVLDRGRFLGDAEALKARVSVERGAVQDGAQNAVPDGDDGRHGWQKGVDRQLGERVFSGVSPAAAACAAVERWLPGGSAGPQQIWGSPDVGDGGVASGSRTKADMTGKE